MKLRLTILLLVLMSGNIKAQKQENQISEMLSLFVSNLNNLELTQFIEHFSDNATVFFPRNTFSIERVKGKDSIKNEFEVFFNNIRQNREGPPYLNIIPKDREIELYGKLAVVTFHFEMGKEFHRRTMVLQKNDDQWKIIHFHASFLERE